MSTGTLDMNNSGLACPVLWNIGGDFSFSGGTMECTSTITGSSTTFNFVKSGVQTFTKATSPTATFTGSTINPFSFTVYNGSTLQMGSAATPSILNGTFCSFALLSGSSLGVTSPGGITMSPTNTGNIQVTTGAGQNSTTARSYSAGTIIYDGTVLQVTGNGLAAAANLSITNNTGLITFNVQAAIAGNISMVTGATADLGTGYIHTASSLTLGGVLQPFNNSYGGAMPPWQPLKIPFSFLCLQMGS
jgi:hypothetical protein